MLSEVGDLFGVAIASGQVSYDPAAKSVLEIKLGAESGTIKINEIWLKTDGGNKIKIKS